ncbi:MAG: type II secretion system protein [Campylobacterota bacterium]|nr:type II secretion system protein [Campylobacterota bacterium]
MKRLAFTMLELVFVIVVIGILSAAIIPRMDRDSIYEMGEQVLSHIKYTQHLAMTDNVYNHKESKWYIARWHIDFVNSSTCGAYYSVGSDADLTNTVNGLNIGRYTSQEAARDPLTNTLIYNNTCTDHDGWYNDVMLGKKYNIVSMTSTCTKRIIFDHIGRPYTAFNTSSHVANKMNNDCNYTFTDGSGNSATITVTAETGYSYITYN